MQPAQKKEGRAWLPLVILHLLAAAACFAFFTGVPITACLILMAIGNDPGGPMFFPMFVLGVVGVALSITVILGGTAVVSDLVRRRWRLPLWVPALLVFGLVAGAVRLAFGEVHPAVPIGAGALMMLAFILHWSAVSATWYLPRFVIGRIKAVLGDRSGRQPAIAPVPPGESRPSEMPPGSPPCPPD